MKNILILLSVALVAMACEKEVKLKAEEQKPRIVANTIFNAATDTVWLSLSESRNLLYTKELPKISGAEAKFLKEDGSEIGSFIESMSGGTKGLYYLPITGGLNVGEKYSLSVNKTGFDAVKATTSIPSNMVINSIDSAASNSTVKGKKFTINFKDNAAEKNYYIVSSREVSYTIEGVDTVTVMETSTISTKEIVAAGNRDISGNTDGEELFFNDETFNGSDFSFAFIHIEQDGIPADIEPKTYFEITVKNVSEAYYKYRLSYAKYQKTNGSPFAEPVQVYSNIEKGFGLFAGYSTYKKRFN